MAMQLNKIAASILVLAAASPITVFSAVAIKPSAGSAAKLIYFPSLAPDSTGKVKGYGDKPKNASGQTCPSSNVAWQVDDAICEAILPGTTGVRTASSSNGNTGNATFLCNSNGTFTLQPGYSCTSPTAPAPADCAAGTRNWVINGKLCTAPGGAIVHGSISTVSDTTPSEVGFGNFQCNDGVVNFVSGQCNTDASPSGCSGATLNWGVGSNSCSGTVSAASNGSLQTSTDSAAPGVGDATFVCNDGSWFESDSTCGGAGATECTAQTVAWSQNGVQCSASMLASSDQESRTVASTNGNNGSASFVCQGQSNTYSSTGTPTCTASSSAASPCPSQSLSWSGGGTTCSAVAPATGSGSQTPTLVDSTVSPGSAGLGQANYICNSGTFTALSTSCNPAPPSNCAAAAVSWNVGGNLCTSNAPARNHGASTGLLSDTGAPTTGSASFTCTNGAFIEAAGSTCNLPPPAPTPPAPTPPAPTPPPPAPGPSPSTLVPSPSLPGVSTKRMSLGLTSASFMNGTAVRVAGLNYYGSHGTGDFAQKRTPQTVSSPEALTSISAGTRFTCGLGVSGQIYCAGNLALLGSQTPRDTFVSIGLSAKAISVGGAQLCFIDSANSLKCLGENLVGLGDAAATTRSTTPIQVAGLVGNVAQVSAGPSSYACATLTDGTARCWGNGANGRLGNGATTNQTTPVAVSGLSGVAGVYTGESNTCAITTAGSVRCWGSNGVGSLGNGNTTSSSVPVQVSGLTSGAKKLVKGTAHACAITASNSVVCWGRNQSGALGDGTTTNRSTPVTASGLTSNVTDLAATNGGFGMGDQTCALVSGQVRCWGRNIFETQTAQFADFDSPLGITATTNPVTTPTSVISSGVSDLISEGEIFCAKLSSGASQCWGVNEVGRLGTNDAITPSLISTTYPEPIIGFTVDTALSSVFAISNTGRLYAHGLNLDGQLGDGTRTNRAAPVLINIPPVKKLASGFYHTCSLSTAGGVKCWGYHGNGQVGTGTNNGTDTFIPTPTDVQGLTSGVVDIEANGETTCAVLSGGGVRCWGRNNGGQIGNGTTTTAYGPVTPTGLTSGVKKLYSAGGTTRAFCATLTAGGMRCWGQNINGSLGNGTTTASTTPVAVSGLSQVIDDVSMTEGSTYVLTSGGAKLAWGTNTNGQLGDGTTTNRSTPVQVIGLSTNVTSINAHCATLSDGQVRCNGSNSFGQLGDGTFTPRTSPVSVVGVPPIKFIDSTGVSVCGITFNDQEVWCWGNNQYGIFGIGTQGNVPTPVRVQ